jgi:hypothetical protein
MGREGMHGFHHRQVAVPASEFIFSSPLYALLTKHDIDSTLVKDCFPRGAEVHFFVGRSRSGRSGKSKKGGGGGKYTWGTALLPHDEAVHSIDSNDPNFNSDEECNPVLLRFDHEDDLLEYKQLVRTA